MAFINSRNLSADVVLRQLLISIFASEVVGSKVYHLVCDAGGSYGKLFTYLRKKKKIPHDVNWLPKEYVSFQNPYDPRRSIYFSFCCTHNCKGGRNQTKESKSNGSKCFLNKHGDFITWDCLVSIPDKEKDFVVDRGGTGDSGLCNKSILPD